MMRRIVKLSVSGGNRDHRQLALNIPKDIRETLKWDSDTIVMMTIDGDKVVVTKENE